MFCENCGNKLADGDMFCQNCGSQLKMEPVADTQGGAEPSVTYPSEKKSGGVGFIGSIITSALMIIFIIFQKQFTVVDSTLKKLEKFGRVVIDKDVEYSFSLFDILFKRGDAGSMLGVDDVAVVFNFFAILLIVCIVFYAIQILKCVTKKKSSAFTIAATIMYIIVTLVMLLLISVVNDEFGAKVYSLSVLSWLGLIVSIASIVFARKYKKEL